ncbi:hypothetical protein SAMN04488505_11526 [Chitinophaga rupis]|uniref:Uncharacterized protein n=1 Tax=Chitinophaga rupis TaxID=573321 RepID=A0A1H8KF69_9BACT|nr:hypothetical protein SAMN04488505_11526 [Chitinophaga rupis]
MNLSTPIGFKILIAIFGDYTLRNNNVSKPLNKAKMSFFLDEDACRAFLKETEAKELAIVVIINNVIKCH